MRNGRKVLLDGDCGAGGATKGYQRAGFYVIGVDIKPQPNGIELVPRITRNERGAA